MTMADLMMYPTGFSWDAYMTPDEAADLATLNTQLNNVRALSAADLRPQEAVLLLQTVSSLAAAIASIRQRIADRADEAFARRDYSTVFNTVSLATEEEAQRSIRTRTTDMTLLGTVTKIDRPGVLVQITRGVQMAPVGDMSQYMIELRTTPVELADKAAWSSRRQAMRAVIAAIDEAAGRLLTSRDADGYRINMLNSMTTVGPQVKPATSLARHATVGVAASEIGLISPTQRRDLRKVHANLTLPWYIETFTADGGLGLLMDREKVGYALVMSAALRLAQIWMKFPGQVNSPEVRDMWQVLPRTPPLQILSMMHPAADQAARRAIAARGVPAWPSTLGPVPTKDIWAKARAHILGERPMGGCALSASAVAGRPAMFFEYRANIPAEYADGWSQTA